MEDIKNVLQELARQKKENRDEMYSQYKRVLNNPYHELSELVKATSDFQKANGEYQGVMDALLKLYELGLI